MNDILLKQDIIDENYKLAYERIPESLIPVKMLYIKGKINDHEFDIFIDTGAQISIMPISIVKQLSLEYLVDYFHETKVVGIGTQNSIGRIHYLDITIDKFQLPCGFTVVEIDKPEIILGLDILKSNGGIIDLVKKCINFRGVEIKLI